MIVGEIRVAPSGGDDALAWQQAIDQAGAVRYQQGIDPVIAPAMGTYHFRTPVRWHSGHFVSPQVGQVRVEWDGPPDATVFTKIGGGSFFLMQGLTLRAGTSRPGTWIDFSQAGNMDVFGRLREVRFAGCSGDAIVVKSWVNCHWEHLRWDAIGGYAIRLGASPSQYVTSFALEQFTYDHQSDDQAPGFLCIDTRTTTSGNAGLVALRDARIEVNTPWGGPQALITHLRGSNKYGKVVQVSLENITYYDIVKMDHDCLYYVDAAAPRRERLLLRNVLAVGANTVIGGNWPADTSFPMPAAGYFAQTYFDGTRIA